jgi:aquaporin Z
MNRESSSALIDPNEALVCLAAHGVSEFLSTLLLLLTVMGVYAAFIAPAGQGWIPSIQLALLVGSTIALIASSPLGKLSGAHMNPAVSLAFWLQGRMHFTEFLVYALGQFSGALVACGLLTLLLPGPFQTVGFGVLSPVAAENAVNIVVLEGAATAGLIAVLFYTLSHKNMTRYAPLALAVYLAAVTFALATVTGASFNPARVYGAAVVAQQLNGQWPYAVAPIIGAATVVMMCRLVSWLPRPLYHRLNHSHRHRNYTWSKVQEWFRLSV